MPQLVRFALPGYANVWQVLVKSTAVVSVIGLQDLVGPRQRRRQDRARAVRVLRAVLGVYLAITWASTRRLRRGSSAGTR